MNTTEPQLSGRDLVQALLNTPERQVAKLSYDQQKQMLAKIIDGTFATTASVGAALFDALKVTPSEVGSEIDRQDNLRRRNAEGREKWKELQIIDAAIKPVMDKFLGEVVRLFGPDYELIRPSLYRVDDLRDRVEVTVPVLEPLAEVVSQAMQGRGAVAHLARQIPEQVTSTELLALVDRRREMAAGAARRAS